MIRLLNHLHRNSVRFLLIGGRGLEAHGYVRNTIDVDLLVPLDELDLLTRVLNGFGYVMTAESPVFSRWRAADPIDEDLDLLYVDPSTFAKLDADAMPMGNGEIPARVPSIAGMIALKLHAMRNNPDRRPRDSLDILALLQRNPRALDLAELRALCERYGPPGIFDTIRPSSE